MLPLLPKCWDTKAPWRTPVNAVLGDIGFIKAFGRYPNSADDDELRIRSHLRHACGFLRRAEVMPSVASVRRQQLLLSLETYAELCLFPNNDCSAVRTPVFIDLVGTPCAVAHLVQVSGECELAKAIDGRFHCASISEIVAAVGHEPVAAELLSWATGHGFTMDELACIQPGYTPRSQCLFVLAIVGLPIAGALFALFALSCGVVGMWAVLGSHGASGEIAADHWNILVAGIALPIIGAMMLAFSGASSCLPTCRVDSCQSSCEYVLAFFSLAMCTLGLMFLVVAPLSWAASGPPIWVKVSIVFSFVFAFIGPTILVVWICIASRMSNERIHGARHKIENIEHSEVAGEQHEEERVQGLSGGEADVLEKAKTTMYGCEKQATEVADIEAGNAASRTWRPPRERPAGEDKAGTGTGSKPLSVIPDLARLPTGASTSVGASAPADLAAGLMMQASADTGVERPLIQLSLPAASAPAPTTSRTLIGAADFEIA